MAEDKTDRNADEDHTDGKTRIGGYFDSLIADFSLDDIPEPPHEDTPDNGEPIIETVDGIVPEKTPWEQEIADTDSVVLFDENAPEENTVKTAEEAGAHFAEEAPKESKNGFFASLFPVKGDSVGEVIRKIVFLIAVVVFIVAAVLLVINLTDSKKALEINEEDKDVIVTTVATTVNDKGEVVTIPPTEEEMQEHQFSVMEHYRSINPDVVGFVELAGCEIAQPVVQTTDNDYYLNHTYFNTINQAGSIFMDYRCTFTEDYTSPNLVLYGHNQRDGTMFGNLKRYKYDLDFYAENPFVTLSSDFESCKYVIFGFFVTNTLEKQDSRGEVFHYHDYIETLSNKGTYGWYLNEIRERNQIISPVDVKYGDHLLVLSTCSNEYSDSRFVVFARKLREDETEDSFDFSLARINNNAKGIDWNAVLAVPTRRTVTETSSETSETSETTTVSETESSVSPSADTEVNIADRMEEIMSRFSMTAETTTAPPEETSRKTKKTTSETSEETTVKTKKTTAEETSEETSAETSTEETSVTTAEESTSQQTTTTTPGTPGTTPAPPPETTAPSVSETVTAPPESSSDSAETQTGADGSY